MIRLVGIGCLAMTVYLIWVYGDIYSFVVGVVWAVISAVALQGTR